jgi:hypothetical protein
MGQPAERTHSDRRSQLSLVRAILLLLVVLAVGSSLFLFKSVSGMSGLTFNAFAATLPVVDSGLPGNLTSTNTTTTTSSINNWSFPELVKANVTGHILRLIPEGEYNRSSEGTMECPISFYVYDDLPYEFSTRIEEIVTMGGIAGSNYSAGENAETELVLLRLFRTSPCRVYDPSTADYYIVPYMHAAHCNLSPGHKWHGCNNLKPLIAQQIIKTLRYYQEAPKQHVFILGWGTFMSLWTLENQHVTLSPGPKNANGSGNNTIVIPLFNDNIRCQPSMLPQSMGVQHRSQAFSFIYGGINKRMRPKSGRRFRIYFAKEITRSDANFYSTSNATPTIGGMPYTMIQIAPNTKAPESVLALYRDSILCPILPGDTSWQRRFFDVISSGCIPLVIEWTLFDGSRSWFTPTNMPAHHLHSIQDSYPFFKGEYQNSEMEVDYDSFLVKITGNAVKEQDFRGLREKIEEILADEEGLRRRQKFLAKFATRLSYGLGADAHRYKDAFWGILQALKIDQTHVRGSYSTAEWLYRKKNHTEAVAKMGMAAEPAKNTVVGRRRRKGAS